MGYILLEESYIVGYPIVKIPDIPDPDANSFLAGRPIILSFDSPLEFEVLCPKDEHPGHYFSKVVPVVSELFIDVLKNSGIDNYQVFPATLVNRDLGCVWEGFYAFNVIGLVDATDHSASKSDVIMPGGFEGPLELVGYHEIVVDSTKVRNLRMFRDVRNPTVLIFDDMIEDALDAKRPPEWFGIRIKKLSSS